MSLYENFSVSFLYALYAYAKDVVFAFGCQSDCPQDNSQNCMSANFEEIFGGWMCEFDYHQLIRFRCDPDHDPDIGILKHNLYRCRRAIARI